MPYQEFRDCKVCGAEFYQWRPTQIFCSVDCRTRDRWSKYRHLEREWTELYEAGSSYKTIADAYGVVPNTVRGFLQYAGVKPRNRWDTAQRLLFPERYADR